MKGCLTPHCIALILDLSIAKNVSTFTVAALGNFLNVYSFFLTTVIPALDIPSFRGFECQDHMARQQFWGAYKFGVIRVRKFTRTMTAHLCRARIGGQRCWCPCRGATVSGRQLTQQNETRRKLRSRRNTGSEVVSVSNSGWPHRNYEMKNQAMKSLLDVD